MPLIPMDTLRTKGPTPVSPFLIPMMLPDMSSGQLSIRVVAKGVNYSLIRACASGADCIGEAANIIRRGDADIALAGGTEAAVTPITVAGFAAARALTRLNHIPEACSRPFDRQRDGFTIAEGAAVLVLEAEEHAVARGAKILAALDGYGATSDAFHITQPDEHGEGAVRAIKRAIEQAGIRPDDVDYINAHRDVHPDLFVMATDVPGIYLNWVTPDPRLIRRTTPEELEAHTFPAGSMGPKVEAACQFVRKTGKRAAIGGLNDIGTIVGGDSGTQVHAGGP